jgi:hypothetical protein
MFDKIIPALYSSFRTSCNKKEYYSSWISFIKSIPLQLQTEFEMFLETGRFQPACIRSIENGLRHYLDFGRNIGFQKLNGKEWIIFSKNCGKKTASQQQHQACHATMLYYELVRNNS